VILQAWGGAAVLVAASLVVGYGVDRLGGRCGGASPAVGFAAVIIVAYTGIALPGRAVTAAVLCLMLSLAAAAVLIVRRPTSDPNARLASPPSAGLRVPVLAGGLAAVGAAMPFIANGRVGLLGVSLDNDTANHMIWAQALRDPSVKARYGLPPGYPLGPHSVADALAAGLGLRLDMAFTALGIATVVLTALVGAAALGGQVAWKRVLAGLMAALLYLVAAYYAEGAFKEPLLGLLLLAFVLVLEQFRREPPVGLRARVGVLVPAGALGAAALYVFSYPAVAWFGLTVALWLAAELAVAAPRVPGWLRGWRATVPAIWPMVLAVILATLVAVILIIPTGGRVSSFAGSLGTSPAASGAITTANLGNLAHALSPYEGLGIWDQADFRLDPDNLFHAGELGALALGVLILGVGSSMVRREFVLPAAVFACAIVYWRSSHGQSPYVTAKALVIAGPVVAVCGMRGLLTTPLRPLPRALALARVAVAVGFVYFAVHSTYEVVRDEPVWPPTSTDELLSLDRMTRGQTVLFLGTSDYADWLFSHSAMSTLGVNSVSEALARPRPSKTNSYGTASDFDSVDPSTINRFRWFVTPRTDYASQPPAGVQLVLQLPLYDLWRRVGYIEPRQVIEASGAPGAILNCGTSAGRALSRRRGVASVMGAPLVAPIGGLEPGTSEKVAAHLGPGSWQLSLQYMSAVGLTVSAAGQRWPMPAYLDRPGPAFAVGNVTSTGAPVTVTISAAKPSALTGSNLLVAPVALIATRLPDRRMLVPLSRACGRYVDWYRLSGA
jgi:hypothetical protein